MVSTNKQYNYFNIDNNNNIRMKKNLKNLVRLNTGVMAAEN